MSENLEPEYISQSDTSAQDILKRELVFDRRFLEDLTYWVETNKKIALRVLSLVEEVRRNPFEGTGKPERLRYQDAKLNIYCHCVRVASRREERSNRKALGYLQCIIIFALLLIRTKPYGRVD